MQTAADGPSRQELTDWHNRTVRLLRERFGSKQKKKTTKRTQTKPPPPPSTANAGEAQSCERGRLATSSVAPAPDKQPLVVRAAEEDAAELDAAAQRLARQKLGGDGDYRTAPAPTKASALFELTSDRPSVSDEQESALCRVKLLLLLAEQGDAALLPPLGANGRRAAAARRYAGLFADSWPVTRKALDDLAELHGMDTLKDKLLLSVMVLSYRDCRTRRDQMQVELDDALASAKKQSVVSDSSSGGGTELAASDFLDRTYICFLQTNADRFNCERTAQDVMDRLLAVLYDYPCLGACKELRRFADECAQVAWDLCTACPTVGACPSLSSCDEGEFCETLHVRRDGCDVGSIKIASCVWPGLVLDDGIASVSCMHKGVVVTR